MTDNVEEILAKLRKLSEASGPDDVHIFDSKEVSVIRRMVETFEMMESWGKLGKWLIWLLMAFAGAMAAINQIGQGLVK